MANRVALEVDRVQAGVPVMDQGARFVDLRYVVVKSVGSTVVKGRFCTADGRAYPLKTGSQKGKSTFTVTVTTEQSLLAALVAAGYVIDKLVTGLIFNTTGSDLYYNTAANSDGTISTGANIHSDSSIDTAFDGFIPGGSKQVVLGRARIATGASGSTSSGGSSSGGTTTTVIGSAQNAVVSISSGADIVVPTAFYSAGVLIEVVNITVSTTPHALATQYAAASSGTAMPSSYNAAMMYPPTSAGSITMYVNYSYNGSTILVAPSSTISTPYAMGVRVPIGPVPDGDLPTNIVGTTDVDTPFVILYTNVKTGIADIPVTGFKSAKLRPASSFVTANVALTDFWYSGSDSGVLSYDWCRNSNGSMAPITTGGRSLSSGDTISWSIQGQSTIRVTIPVTASDGQSFAVLLSRNDRIIEFGQTVTSDNDFADQGFKLRGVVPIFGQLGANQWERQRGHKNSMGVVYGSKAPAQTVTLAAAFASVSIKTSNGILACALVTTIGAGTVTFYDTPNSTISGKKIIGQLVANSPVTGIPVWFDMPGLTGIWAEVTGVAPAITVGYF